MPAEKKSDSKSKAITEIGKVVPGSFKFGLIVAVAMFWADFLRSLLNGIFSLANVTTPIVTDLILAVCATALGYLILISYQKIKSRLEKVKL